MGYCLLYEIMLPSVIFAREKYKPEIMIPGQASLLVCGFCDEAYFQVSHGSLALDSALVRKFSKRHFFQDIKNSFHGVTRMGLKPHQNFFQFFFSTNMVARGVQSFCILEGATDPLIEK